MNKAHHHRNRKCCNLPLGSAAPVDRLVAATVGLAMNTAKKFALRAVSTGVNGHVEV
jgi:hypothetical protein